MATVLKPGDKDFYADTQWERKPHGSYVVDGQEVAHSLMCPHCGSHFISRKGSGARRGFCMKCKAVTCGRPECGDCFPLEKQLELMEKIGDAIAKG